MKTLSAVKWGVLIAPLLMLCYTCKKLYSPPASSTKSSYLVVEGVISSGDSTIITLSRTTPLNSSTAAKPETGAAVAVEDNAGNSFPLKSDVAGIYYTAPLTLDVSKMYRLRITTSDNNVYLSDLVPVKNSPPIDSIGYTVEPAGMQIYVNTHDASNNTRYYRWEYEETWKFHAKYASNWESNGVAIIPRPMSQQIYTCFNQDKSTDIVINSSAKLAKDVIYQSPIQFISSTSEKIELRYSILVRQYALTPDAYNFWSLLKKNTENLGTIFDAQPSELQGNIHNTTNPSAVAIGYISCGSVQTKRVYYDILNLPDWQATYPYSCQLFAFSYKNPKTLQNDVLAYLIPLPPTYLPTDSLKVPGGPVTGFYASTIECADCTIRGTTTPPAFWKDN